MCFRVRLLWRTNGSLKWAWVASDRHVWFQVWGWRADFRRRGWEEEESNKARSKDSSHGCSWLLSILHCSFIVLSVSHFLCFRRWCRSDSGSFRKWRRIYWRGDWRTVEEASHSCYQEPGTFSWGAPTWCPWGWGCPQSRSEPGVVGADVWWW